MKETWYRGESTIVGPARPGVNLHDFGEGIYFTSSADVARQYALLRVSEGGGDPRVLSLTIDRAELGNVLNLNADARWLKFMRTPMTPNGLTPEQIIRTAGNENYGRLFSGFLAENKIDLRSYNAVEGPELVRGGTQLCVLRVGNQQGALASKLKQSLMLDTRFKPTSIAPSRVSTVYLPAPQLMTPNSPTRRILGNQAAVALFGQLIASGLQRIGEYGIKQQAKQDIDGRLANEIVAIRSRGEGVLVIVAIRESLYSDFNGYKSRMYLTSYVQAAHSPAQALQKWQSQPKFLQGAPPGLYIVEEYVWLQAR